MYIIFHYDFNKENEKCYNLKNLVLKWFLF